MSTGVYRPQELICAVEQGATPVLEVWFAGGRGSQRHPVQVEVLGTVDRHGRSLVCDALEHLMRRYGPWLFLDLSSVAFVDEGGQVMLEVLEQSARRRGGHVSCGPPYDEHERHWLRAGGGGSVLRRPDGSVEPPPAPCSAGMTVRRSMVEDDVQAVLLEGELDAGNVVQLERAILLVLELSDGPVVLDLTDVAFLDCSVIGCLLSLRRRFANTARPITLRNPTPTVRRTLEITGVLDTLGVS